MRKQISVGLLGLLVVSGCTTFRGIPSHGGGKRFDEEQRLIAASIYKALEEMQCNELRGKKVRIVHEFTTTYGSGNANFGGLQDITLLPSYSFSDADYDGESYSSRKRELRDTYSWGNVRYRPNMTFYTSNANTDRDAAFFRSCLEMKLWHEEAVVVPKGEDVTLYVLLDVLGTNRSRKDRLIQTTEFLNASCEFTYYAIDVKTGKLLFHYRRNGGVANYKESTVLFLGTDKISRSVEACIPLDMPILDFSDDSEENKTVSKEKPAAKPDAKPTQKPAAKPVTKPASKPEPKPQEKPASKPAAKSVQKPVEKKPAEKPVPKTAEKPAQKPAAKPEVKPAPKPEPKPAAKPVQKAVEKKPAAKPASAETVESKPQTSSEAKDKKADQYRLSKEQKEKELRELRDQARMLIETGRDTEAKETYNRINTIDPNADEAQEIEQLLLKKGLIE